MAHNVEARLNSYWPVALSVFRVMFGLLFLCHGLSNLISWPVPPVKPVEPWSTDYFAGWIETITGVLITFGLFTRAAAFLAAGEMAVAYFTVHLPNGFFPIANHGELAVMYCFAFLLLLFAGGGAYALDARRGRWRSTGAPRRTGRWGPNRRLLRR
ncbi:MAG: DoxX family protein [Mycobacterium sp.]|nr:DoxX family protein [Mycobacterium sp.]